jgi:adenine-specific DNA-methyltransferase
MTYRLDNKYKEDSNLVLECNDALTFLKKLPSNSITLTVTSPPYNIGKSYETRVSINEYLETQKLVIEELIRVLTNDGSICWQVGNYVQNGEIYPLDIFFYKIFKDHGLQLRNRIIWHFGHGLHANKRFSGRYETILWFTKNDNYIFNLDPVRVASKYPGKKYYKGKNKGQFSCNPRGKNPSDFWEFLYSEWDREIWEIPNVKSNHPEKTEHPCQFPIELVERCVLALTNESDIVLDPYAGVGSSIIAAIRHNRKGYGVDKEESYIRIGHQRIVDYLRGNLKIRQMGKPVYQPTGKEKIVQIPQEWTEDVNRR